MSRDMLWQVIERHFPDEEGLMEGVRKERWVTEIFNWNERTVWLVGDERGGFRERSRDGSGPLFITYLVFNLASIN
jgi:hypothetical protein